MAVRLEIKKYSFIMQSLASRWDQHHRCALQLIPEGKKGGRNLELLIKLVKKKEALAYKKVFLLLVIKIILVLVSLSTIL